MEFFLPKGSQFFYNPNQHLTPNAQPVDAVEQHLVDEQDQAVLSPERLRERAEDEAQLRHDKAQLVHKLLAILSGCLAGLASYLVAKAA